MVEGTDLRLVAPIPVAVDPFVLVWVVQTLDCRVALVAEKSVGALLPAILRVLALVRQRLAILWRVLEDLGRASEVPHVVGVDAAFRVMRVFPVWTPARLVSEHVECKHFETFVDVVQVLVKGRRFQQAVNNDVVLDRLVRH